MLAKAIGTIDGVDLVIAGNEATDGTLGRGARDGRRTARPARSSPTPARSPSTAARSPSSARPDEGLTHLQASLPAVVSVTEKINEPRYPSFKGIMAAKKKPVTTLTVADLGIDAGEVGLANAWSSVVDAAPKPPRTAGEKVEDDGQRRHQGRRVPHRPEADLTSRAEQERDTMSEVLVLVEQVDGEVKKVTNELLTAARRLGEPSAVVVGAPGTAAKVRDALAGLRRGQGLRRRVRRRHRLPGHPQGRRARRGRRDGQSRPPC